jgi:hypothetical protein
MTLQAGPLYELTFSVGPAVAAEFDSWLIGFSEETSHKQGVADTRIFASPASNSDNRIWVLQIQCLDDGAFDDLQESVFADIEPTISENFNTAVSVSSRIFREDTSPALLVIEYPDCLNCGTRLQGQYCGVCGQRARSRLISLWELISDAFGDLFELDSRIWRTLIPLLVRPGRLTRDYLEGKRARYMPPFRSYLVLSLVFFLVAFFDPRDDLGLLFEPEPEPTAEEIAANAAEAAAAKQQVPEELASQGIILDEHLTPDGAQEANHQPGKAVAEDTDGINVRIGDEDGNCNVSAADLEELPEWFRKRFTPERLSKVCERVTEDGGKSFVGLLLDNIPVALIVLLPLMALVLKILYPLSRRYFVEHLLFVVHYHAFFFLILTLQILFARLAGLIRVPEAMSVLPIVVASLYIPVYLYMAMRHVYGQGRITTFIKYVGLVAAYGMGTTLTMLGAVLFALVAVS